MDVTRFRRKKPEDFRQGKALELVRYAEVWCMKGTDESGTEANYDMVDGQVNNQKKAVEKAQKPTSNRPKKRTSVIRKLHEKQIAIAKRSGKPVPRYLEQQMVQERSRK